MDRARKFHDQRMKATLAAIKPAESIYLDGFYLRADLEARAAGGKIPGALAAIPHLEDAVKALSAVKPPLPEPLADARLALAERCLEAERRDDARALVDQAVKGLSGVKRPKRSLRKRLAKLQERLSEQDGPSKPPR